MIYVGTARGKRVVINYTPSKKFIIAHIPSRKNTKNYGKNTSDEN